MTDFEELKQAVIEICHEREACRKGYKDLLECENTPQLVECFCRYWSDILGTRFNEQAIAFMDKYYQPYRDLWRRCGLAYQEGNDHGYCWLREVEDAECSGSARVYCIGKCKVTLRGRAEAILENCDGSEIELYEQSRCQCKADCIVRAHEASHPNMMAGRCYADGQQVRVDAGGSADVYATAWQEIIATGFARIYTPSRFRTKLFSNAEWIQSDGKEVTE